MTDEDVVGGGEEKFHKTRLDDSEAEAFGQVNVWNPMLCQHTFKAGDIFYFTQKSPTTC